MFHDPIFSPARRARSHAAFRRFSSRLLDTKGPRVTVVHGDGCAMTFADDSFDLVIAAYVVTAVPDYRKLMSEMVRVSRPGGRLVLLNHFTQTSPMIAAVEKAISPICVKIGFRTDLSVDEVIDGWPPIKERDDRVKREQVNALVFPFEWTRVHQGSAAIKIDDPIHGNVRTGIHGGLDS